MRGFKSETFDMVLTSPPYDDLREYNGFSFSFEEVARELYRLLKQGGVIVWVVGDAVVNGSESGTSFRQALFFKGLGLNIHDTMIYQRMARFPDDSRYQGEFEYMFVFSKGKPKTFNPISDVLNKKRGVKIVSRQRESDGSLHESSGSKKGALIKEKRVRGNIWWIDAGFNLSTKDVFAFEHPAIFPEKLAEDHLLSWSNEGDTVLDPFLGSGTTLKCAKYLNRNATGIEISPKYCEIARKRLAQDSLFASQEPTTKEETTANVTGSLI